MASDSKQTNQAISGPVAAEVPMMPVPPGLYGALAFAGGETHAGPPGLSAPPTLAGLVHALRRRWTLGFGLAAAAALLAVGAVFVFMPPRYMAEARFTVAASSDGGLLIQGPNQHIEFAVYKEYQKALVRSPLILNAALNEKVTGNRDARDLPMVRAQGNGVIEWMDRSIKSEFKIAPEIMTVWLSGDDPDGMADLLNAVGSAYVKENKDKEEAKRKERIDLYRENLKVKEQELANLRTKLNAKLDAKRGPDDTKDRVGKDPQLSKDRQLKQALQDLFACNLLTQNLQSRQRETDLELADLQAKAKFAPTASPPLDYLDDYLRGDLKSKALLEGIEFIDGKIIEIERTAANPQQAKELIAKELATRTILQEKVEKRRRDVVPELESRYRVKFKAELAEKIQSAERRRDFLGEQIKGLAQQADALNRQITLLDPDSLSAPPDLQHLMDEIKSIDTACDQIRQTILKLSVEGANTRVSLQMRASAPTDRDYSRQSKMAGAGGFSAFGLVLFGVALWEFRTRRISRTDEVSRGLGLNVVGSLPAISARPRTPASAETGKELLVDAQLQEAVDGVRTMLLHASRTEPLRVIMVTSACGGEGKTSVASQLAASLARAWRKTLLVDGDMRNPAAHKVFDLPREPGLSEVLRGEVAVNDAIRPAAVSRLWVLPAGHWDNQAIEALAQDNVATLFEQLKGQYDFVIVDSCPVLPVADSLLLGQHADGVLFSILRDVSRAPEVYAAQQRLAPLGIRTLGAVVIGMSNDLSSRAYQYASK